MQDRIRTIEKDLDLNNNFLVNCNCKQYDTIKFIFHMFMDGEVADLSDCIFRLQAKKGDGLPYINNNSDNISVIGNIVTIDNDNQLTARAGDTFAEVVITDKNGHMKTTFDIRLNIKSSAIDGLVDSEATITVMEDLNNILNDAYDVQADFEDKIDNATKAKTDLETTTNTANTTKVNLDTSITTATTTKTNLDKSNTTALSTKSLLDTSNTNATKTKSDLDSINTIALKTTSDLNTSNTNAITNKSALDTTNTNAINTKNTLDTLNTNATKTKTDLTTVNTNATTTKNDLNALNINAQATKTNLDASKVSADTSKKNLDTSITNANKFIDEHGNIIEMLIDIENLLGKVPLDGGTFFEQYDEWKVDSGTF